MTRPVRLVVASALIVGLVLPVGAQQTVFRAGSDLVRVFVTVTDRDDRLVTTLTKDQFELRDEGRVQPILVFDNTPQPIQLIVMLDVSGSMMGNLPLLRAASANLFTRLRPDDVARVGTFGREVTIAPVFTNDARELIASLPTEIPPDAPTPLWRAVDDAIGSFDGANDRRRVVLVLSDGKDTGRMTFTRGFVSQADVADRARDQDVMIYGVGLRSRGPMPPAVGLGAQGLSAMLTADLPDPGLSRVAIDTGGGYLEIGPRDDLAAAFARVADELHSQYLLGYAPPARDGKVRDIRVRVTERGHEVRARKQYVAPRPPASF